jgi:HEAT repeat protein
MIGDPKSIHYLTAAFFNEDDEELSKMLARELLSEFNHEKKERAVNIMYIGYKRSAKEIEMLIEGLSSEDSDIRWVAAGSLGRIKDERAIEPLIEALKDENRRVRLIAAEALGKTSNEIAYITLKKLLEDSDNSVQKAVLSNILSKFFKDR